MSRSLHRRLDAIAKILTPELIEHIEEGAAKVEIADRVASWTATREDFEVLVASAIDDVRRKLIDQAVDHRWHRWCWGPPREDEWRPQLFAAAMVDYAPTEPEHLRAFAALKEAAKSPGEVSPGWGDPWTSYWFAANQYLVALGEDHGATLHEEAAEAMAAARVLWLGGREELASIIRSGDPRRLDFYSWVLPDLEARRDELLARAAERRSRRQGGDPLDIDDVYDAAEEVASYFPDEPDPEAAARLRCARTQVPPVPGSPAREEWMQANELHWILGPGDGKQTRERLKVMLTKATAGTIGDTIGLERGGHRGAGGRHERLRRPDPARSGQHRPRPRIPRSAHGHVPSSGSTVPTPTRTPPPPRQTRFSTGPSGP